MRRVLCMALISAIGMSASAQIAPPPPPPPEDRPAVAPPPEPISRPEPPNPDTPRRVPSPRVSSVEYDSLVVTGADGRIIRIEEPLEYAALAHNTLVGFSAMARMAPALYERRLRAEQLVIAHLAVLEELEHGGKIDGIEVSGDQLAAAELLAEIINAIQAINSDGTLMQHLGQHGMINRNAAALNQTIQADYQSKVISEIQLSPQEEGGPAPLDLLTRQALRDSLSEPLYWRNRLFLEAADAIDTVLSRLDLDGSVLRRVEPLHHRLFDADDVQERIAIVREILSHLTPDQRTAALQATIELRPPVDHKLLMPAPGPEDVMVEMTTPIRRELLWRIIEGETVDITPFIENLPEDSPRRKILPG